MIKFNKDKILLIHQLIAEATGGDVGVRDESLVDSAAETIYTTFDGVELYPTKEEKAAKLCYSLISNNAFIDGNKRIGMHVMLSFLEVNGVKIDATNDDVYKLGMAIADGTANNEDIINWINKHKIN